MIFLKVVYKSRLKMLQNVAFLLKIAFELTSNGFLEPRSLPYFDDFDVTSDGILKRGGKGR